MLRLWSSDRRFGILTQGAASKEKANGERGLCAAIPEAVRIGSDRLDSLYGLSRYPSSRVGDPRPSELIGEDQARAGIAAAGQVMKWVEGLLRRTPGRPHSGKR